MSSENKDIGDFVKNERKGGLMRRFLPRSLLDGLC